MLLVGSDLHVTRRGVRVGDRREHAVASALRGGWLPVHRQRHDVRAEHRRRKAEHNPRRSISVHIEVSSDLDEGVRRSRTGCDRHRRHGVQQRAVVDVRALSLIHI